MKKPQHVVRDFPDGAPLGDARAWLRSVVETGGICPCCKQVAQVHRWSLYSTAAQALILNWQLGGTTEYIHNRQLKDAGHKGQGDHARNKVWDLVEREKAARPDGGRSGYWRVTEKGEAFVRGQLTIPRHAYVYASRVLRIEGEPFTIHDALGNEFSYDALMARQL